MKPKKDRTKISAMLFTEQIADLEERVRINDTDLSKELRAAVDLYLLLSDFVDIAYVADRWYDGEMRLCRKDSHWVVEMGHNRKNYEGVLPYHEYAGFDLLDILSRVMRLEHSRVEEYNQKPIVRTDSK